MFNPKNRLRFAPGIVFNQPAGEGGGSGQPQAGAGDGTPTAGDTPAAGTPSGTGTEGTPAGFQAPWEKSGEQFDEARAKSLLQAKAADEQKLRDQLKQFEAAQKVADDAKLTDQQRLEKERDEEKSGRAEATLEAARLRAAIKYGLAEDDLEFIHGKTTDEVMAAAERYADRHKSDTQSLPSRQPRTPRGGGNPAEEPDELDPRKLAESIPQLH